MGTPLTDIGAVIDVAEAIPAQVDYTGGNVDGTTIAAIGDNGERYYSATFFMSTAGGTAADEVVATLYESSDGGSTWAKATDDDGDNITLTCDDAADTAELDVKLKGLEADIRLELDTGDQTVDTNIDLYAVVVLGGAARPPQD